MSKVINKPHETTLLPNNLIIEISKFLQVSDWGALQLLNKSMREVLKKKLKNKIFYFKDSNIARLDKNKIQAEKGWGIANIGLSVINKDEYVEGQLFMAEMHWGKKRLGLVPLLYEKGSFSINCNERKYKSVIECMNSGEKEDFFIKVVPITKLSSNVMQREIIFIINYYKVN